MDVLRSELHHVKQDQAGMVEDGSANQRPRGRRVSRVREAKKAWTTPPAREQCEPTFQKTTSLLRTLAIFINPRAPKCT